MAGIGSDAPARRRVEWPVLGSQPPRHRWAEWLVLKRTTCATGCAEILVEQSFGNYFAGGGIGV